MIKLANGVNMFWKGKSQPPSAASPRLPNCSVVVITFIIYTCKLTESSKLKLIIVEVRACASPQYQVCAVLNNLRFYQFVADVIRFSQIPARTVA